MYFVLSKEKIYAYIVSILTVLVLFGIATINKETTIETGSIVQNLDSMDNNTELKENKIIIIEDCKYSEDDIRKTLQWLEKENNKIIIFFEEENISNNKELKNMINKEKNNGYMIMNISELIKYIDNKRN